MKTLINNLIHLVVLTAGLGLMVTAQLRGQPYEFCAQTQSAPSASITLNAGTGVFQYSDSANTTDDTAYIPLCGSTASLITNSTGWSASINVSLAERSMTAENKVWPHCFMALVLGKSDDVPHTYVVMEVIQSNNTGGGDNSDYPDGWFGAAARFGSHVSGVGVVTTPLGVSLLSNGGGSFLPLCGETGTPDAPRTEAICATAGVLSLIYDASSKMVTGYYKGTAIGSYSLASWGPNPAFTLVVAGGSGEGLAVPLGTDTASNLLVGTKILTQVTVNTNGVGVLTPNDNGALLEIGNSYSITASPATGSGYAFVNWTGGTSQPLAYITNALTLHFVMDSNLVLQANFVDTNRPVVSITNAASGLTVSNAAFTLMGMATDNWAVASVWVQLGQNGWVHANGTNRWNLPLVLESGTNTVAVYAVDAAGNYSVTNSQTIVYLLSAPISLVVVGDGAVIGAVNGQLLQIGKNVTLTAKPGQGDILTNWLVTVDGQTVISTNMAVPFVMRSNLVLTATFVDVTKPTLNVISPATSLLRVTNALVSIKVHATDNYGVDKVQFYLNGKEAASETYLGANNWSIKLSMAIGINNINVIATDFAGNSTTKAIQVIYANSQMNTNSVTFAERHSASLGLPSPPGFDLVMFQDTGLLSVALMVPELQFMPYDTWSNLFVSVSFGDFAFADFLSDAVTLNTSQALFYFGASGDLSTAGNLIVARSGNILSLTAQINNLPGQVGDSYSFYTNYWYPGSALTFESPFQDEQPFNLSIEDGETAKKYATVIQSIHINGNVTSSDSAQTGETYQTQVTGAADYTPPTVTIVSPSGILRTTNDLTTVVVDATDNIGVSNVEFYLNGQDFGAGAPQTHTNFWARNFSLAVGTNVVAVVGQDRAGNLSRTNLATFVYVNQQTNANTIVITEKLLMNFYPGPPSFLNDIVEDTGILNAALKAPGFQLLSANTWSNLYLSVSFGYFSFSGYLGEADALTTNAAIFNFLDSNDLTGNLGGVEEFAITRVGNDLDIVLRVGNAGNLEWPISIIAGSYFPIFPYPMNPIFSPTPTFNLTLQDGNTLETYFATTNVVHVASQYLNGLLQVSGAADFIAPTNIITSPTNGQHSSNAVFNVTGTARDNVQVANVFLQVNGAGWLPATTRNSWTNWMATVTLRAGTNSVNAYAVDASGNCSATNMVSLVSRNTFKLQLAMTNIPAMKANGLIFSLGLSSGLNGHIQVSTNLLDWTTLTNFIGTNSTIMFRDLLATNSAHRYYRAVIP